MSKNQVLLFNPKSAKWKHRIPMSILQVGASVYPEREVIFVDGNAETDPYRKIRNHIIDKLKKENFGTDELGVIQALLLGQRSDISEETYKVIKSDFECEYRGELAVKNRGDLKMYFVT